MSDRSENSRAGLGNDPAVHVKQQTVNFLSRGSVLK